jgi:hypothetical protein
LEPVQKIKIILYAIEGLAKLNKASGISSQNGQKRKNLPINGKIEASKF